jgi:hypothetical protein
MMQLELRTQARMIAHSHDAEAFVRWCTEAAGPADIAKLNTAFGVYEHRYWSEMSSENRYRLLYNRIVGYQHRYRKYRSDPLGRAMDANKALWRDYYADYRYANAGDWLNLVLAVSDTLQQHGHEGIWGGCISYAKTEEGFSYRNLYHDDSKTAYNEEFYSLLFGWW